MKRAILPIAALAAFALTTVVSANSLRQFTPPADAAALPAQADLQDAKPASMEELLTDFSVPVKPPKTLSGKPKSDLVIPKETDKTDFLIGHWRCHTGLVSVRSGEPVELDFYFGKDGLGSTVLKESQTKHIYEGTAFASLKNGELRIESSRLSSPQSNVNYNPSSIRCRQQGDTAVCDGKNGNITWTDVTFERIE